MHEPLRKVMLAAAGAGELAGPGLRHGSAEHPVCGDLVEVDLRCADGRIEELRWRAQGCPATMAVAAAAWPTLRGVPLAEVEATLRARVAALGGLDRIEQHALGMFLRALRAARPA